MEQPAAKKVALSSLDRIKKLSVVVADTGDFDQIHSFKPEDGTTNPSLLLQAAEQKKEYAHLVDDAVAHGKQSGLTGEAQVDEICDKLAVNFGCEILKIVPGVVSTEVDASLSFDTQGSIAKGKKIIAMYEAAGIDKSRILIKLATTWEGCQAAKALEAEGIHTNMTLLFSMAQAKAAAEAGATLISPFVGRILDWHKKNDENLRIEQFSDDPGVKSVTEIYNYYKKFGHKTVVMAASFRNVGEIMALGGCDKLTISPKLLDELSKSHEEVEHSLKATAPSDVERPEALTEAKFRWEMNEDAMATEKLSEGIRNFNKDANKLKETVRARLVA